MGNNTQGIAYDPSLAQVFVTNFNDGTGTVVDINSMTVIATVPLGTNPKRIVDNAVTHRAYVSLSNNPGSVFVGDTTFATQPVNVPAGNNPRGLAADFFISRLYATNVDDKTVSVIDTTTNTVVAVLPVGAGAGAAETNGILKKGYVANTTDNTVTVIDELALTTKTIGVGKGPGFCATDGQHAKVYCNNVTDKTISVIDSNTDTVIAVIPSGAGNNNNFGTVSGVYHRFYLPNGVDGTLTIVDTDNDTVTNTVPVGMSPTEAIVDADGGDVYVVNSGSNSVTVINAASETVVGSFAVGGAPWRMIVGLRQLFVLNTNGAAQDSMTIATPNDSIADTAIATEFYHAVFNHYFHTANETETRYLVDGAFGDDWHRTFEFFRVWTTPGPGRLPVSRFFSTQWGTKSSHFYTANQAERAALISGQIAGWQLEADNVYYIILADANGNCPDGTSPLYRMYNNGMGGAPNHRFTVDRATRDMMVAQGWVGEGQGPDVVYGCVPTLLNG
jgi:YVTN family beta-propeller protein